MVKAEIMYLKNVVAQVAIDFKLNKYLALKVIEKIKILAAILELPAKQHCQSSPFISKLCQIAMLFSS